MLTVASVGPRSYPKCRITPAIIPNRLRNIETIVRQGRRRPARRTPIVVLIGKRVSTAVGMHNWIPRAVTYWGARRSDRITSPTPLVWPDYDRSHEGSGSLKTIVKGEVSRPRIGWIGFFFDPLVTKILSCVST